MRTSYRPKALPSSEKHLFFNKTEFFGQEPCHVVHLPPLTPQSKAQFKRLGNKKLRRQHKVATEQPLLAYYSDMERDYLDAIELEHYDDYDHNGLGDPDEFSEEDSYFGYQYDEYDYDHTGYQRAEDLIQNSRRITEADVGKTVQDILDEGYQPLSLGELLRERRERQYYQGDPRNPYDYW